ncbi:MAG TPA: type II toxin-antitoxin system Phd/YefM family antitoxin [Bacteroidales bacterium]|nr:type II toxin-antitoxin system Phd/YefM family antitoxin [Bacteroidales bacterium]
MMVANFTEFRTSLKKFLDNVVNHIETLIIKRGTGIGAVTISLDEYKFICSVRLN